MNNIRTVVGLLSIVLLLGCTQQVKDVEEQPLANENIDSVSQIDTEHALADASTGGDQDVVKAEDEVFCTMVKPTGSRIPVKYCRTVSDDDRNREIARGWVDQVKSMPQQSIDSGQ